MNPSSGGWVSHGNQTMAPGQENHDGLYDPTPGNSQIQIRGNDAEAGFGVVIATFDAPTSASPPTVWNLTAVNPDPTRYFKATVSNPTDSMVRAWWTLNGSTVHEQYLAPGESASYTFTYDSTESGITLDYGYDRIDYDPNSGDTVKKPISLGPLDPGEGGEDPGDPPEDSGNTSNREPLPWDPSNPSPIDWSGGPTGDDVNKRGFDAIVGELNEDTDKLLAELVRIRNASEFMTNHTALEATQEPGTHNDGDEAKSAVETIWNAAGATHADLTNGVFIPSSYSPSSMSLTTQLYAGPGATFGWNIDPLQIPWISSFAYGMRCVGLWLIAILVALTVFKSVQKSFLSLIQSPQATTIGQSIAGFNIALPSALVVATIITAVIVAGLVLTVGFWKTLWPGEDPLECFAATGAVQAAALYYADAVFPIRAALTAIVAVVVSKIVLMVTTGIQAGIIRMLTGA